jgi:hypothetical protein
MPLSREPFFLRMTIWLSGLKRWYLVLGGVAEGRGFEPQSVKIAILRADNMLEYLFVKNIYEICAKLTWIQSIAREVSLGGNVPFSLVKPILTPGSFNQQGSVIYAVFCNKFR